MSPLSVAFVRCSVVYLLVGISLGIIMAFPGGLAWLIAIGHGSPNFAHAHSNLLGFMFMMISGVAYHIFPRFTGNPLKYPWLSWVNFWLVQVGTAGQVLGFLFQGLVPWLLPVAASINVIGIGCFFYNMWQVVRPLQRIAP